ncbi:MAG: hypothetical protein IKZ87_05530 [Actinomycetaceae bacterium]|nr:hypothetical protein [Actinomycetaceae bacterium]
MCEVIDQYIKEHEEEFRAEAIERGRAEGRAEGKNEERISTIQAMLQMGRFALDDIAAATRTSLAEVQMLAAQAH